VIPLIAGFERNPDLTASGHADRAAEALLEIQALMGSEDGIAF
jgi:hypothetical protein